MEITHIELVIPSAENPFGKLGFGVEFPLAFDATKTYPPLADSKEVVLSEKSTTLLGQLKESMLEDIDNASKHI